MRDERIGLPKRRCYSLIQIICAAVSAGEGMGEPVSIAEATDALYRIYPQGNPCEMLHDGSWRSLTEPYSAKFQYTGVELENKMIDSVCELLNDRWWEPLHPVLGSASKKAEKYENILVAKNDAEAIWKRMWPILFDGEPAILKQFVSLDPVRYSESDSVTPNSLLHNPVTDVIGSTQSNAPIQGETIARLQRAIAAFPSRYPDHRTRPPKLDSDVRPWMKEVGLTINDAEMRVFGKIIYEHFKFSTDTP